MALTTDPTNTSITAAEGEEIELALVSLIRRLAPSARILDLLALRKKIDGLTATGNGYSYDGGMGLDAFTADELGMIREALNHRLDHDRDVLPRYVLATSILLVVRVTDIEAAR